MMQLMRVSLVLSSVAFSRQQSQLSDQQEFLNLNQEQGPSHPKADFSI